MILGHDIDGQPLRHGDRCTIVLVPLNEPAKCGSSVIVSNKPISPHLAGPNKVAIFLEGDYNPPWGYVIEGRGLRRANSCQASDESFHELMDSFSSGVPA